MRHQYSLTTTFTVVVLSLALPVCIAANGKSTKSVQTATAAIKGSEGSSTGEAYGVVGTSTSPDGAGLGAANLAGGADLVLDGSSDGQADALLSQGLLDRPSASPQTFNFTNSTGGGMALRINGVDVVTTATDSDALGALSCMPDQMPLWNGGNWICVNRLVPRDPGQHLALNGNALDVVGGPGSGLDADTLDGLHATQLSQDLNHVVTVSPTGGDYSSIQAALDSITDAAEDNRYLVKIGPGVYVEQVTMKPFVDIEGSGQDVTTIRWGAGGTTPHCTVLGTDHAQLRFLTVDLTAGNSSAAMINDGTSPTLFGVLIRKTGGLFNVAISNRNGASPSLTHCRLVAEGNFATGASNEFGSPRFKDVVIEANGDAVGIQNSSATPELIDVGIHVVGGGMGEAYGIYNNNGHLTLRSCTITVGEQGGASIPAAYGIFGTSFSAQTIVDSEISVGNADLNTAIFASGSGVEIANSRLVATGANPEGIHAQNQSSTRSEVRVSSSSIDIDMGGLVSLNCFAVFGDGANLQVDNSTLRNSSLWNCQQGVSFRAGNSSDRVFISHTFIRGSYSTVPGVTETCLAVSEYLVDPLFYANTCP